MSIEFLKSIRGTLVQSLSESATVVATDSALATTIDGEAVILETESGTYFGLNEVATYVWDQLQNEQTVSDLRDGILEQYDVSLEQCETDLEETLQTMERKGLITVEGS